jgi:hypothetical protein
MTTRVRQQVGRNINLYATDDQMKQVRALHRALTKRGAKLVDNRGNTSDSRLFRELLKFGALNVDAFADMIKSETEGQGGADES